MNQEKQRIAIAELCGWTPRQVTDPKSKETWTCWDKDGKTASIKTGLLPDYLNDLNAIRDAEKRLDAVQWSRYLSEIEKTALAAMPDFMPDWKKLNPSRVLDAATRHAPPSVLCECMVRALGKWEES